MNPPIEIITDIDSCIGCKECVHGCAQEALFFIDRKLIRDRGKCVFCLNCVEICPSRTHKVQGPSPGRDKR